MQLTPVEAAIREFGGVRPLARQIGVTGSAVIKWRNKPGGMIPAYKIRTVLTAARDMRINFTERHVIHGKRVKQKDGLK